MPSGIDSNRVAGLTKRDLIFILFRRKGLILTFLVSAVLASVLYVLVASPTYESTAKLLIRIGPESSNLDPTTSSGRTVTVAQSMQQVVKSEIEILNSQEMAEQVVDAIGVSSIEDPPPDPAQPGGGSPSALGDGLKDLRKTAQLYTRLLKEKLGLVFGDLTPRQRATKKLLKNLDPEGVNESNIIVITSDAETRTMAQRILQELLKFYLGKHLEVFKTLGSADFFLEQAKTLEASIAANEERLRKLKNDAKIVSLDIQEAAVAQRIAGLQSSIQTASATLAADEARIATITAMRKQSAPDTRWQVEKLVNDQDELSQRNEIAVLRAQLATYTSQMASAEEERRQVIEAEGQIRSIENALDTDRAVYKTYLQSVEQVRIDSVLKDERISNVRVVQTPSLPIEKESPKALIDLALGIFVGVFGGIGLAFLVEHYDNSVKRPDDVEEHLGVTTLATVPRVRARMRNVLSPKKGDLSGPFMQAMRTLSSRLTLPAEGTAPRPRVFGVTSAYSHEGVTTICSHLAPILAGNNGTRVLLVDANSGDPAIHQIFGTPAQPGLKDAVNQRERKVPAVHDTTLLGLQVVPAGAPSGAALTYEEDGVLALVDAWRRDFDLVVVDMPPLGNPSTIRLAGLLDGVLVIVEADRVRWQVLERLKGRLEEANARIFGVVINKMRYPIPSWLYRRI